MSVFYLPHADGELRASKQFRAPPVCPLASHAHLGELLPQVLPWLPAFPGLGSCLLHWLELWRRGAEVLHRLFGSRGPCQVLLQTGLWCPLSGGHLPEVCIAWAGGGRSAPWESHAVLEAGGGQQHLEEASAEPLAFWSMGAVAATLVQLEAKGRGVLACPGERWGGGSQLGESSGPPWGRCPQTSPAGRACRPSPVCSGEPFVPKMNRVCRRRRHEAGSDGVDVPCRWRRKCKQGEAMLNLGRWLRSCGDRSPTCPRALWWAGKLLSRGARLPLFQSAPLYLLY